jgi:primosomal protein N' (replication factor Y) (superfamily II helicase)
MPKLRFLNITMPLPLSGEFTYSVEGYGDKSIVGKRSLVKFNGRYIIGFVTSEAEKKDPEGILPVLEILDDEPVIDPEMLNFCRWLSDYYLCPLGETLKLALPSVLLAKTETSFRSAKNGAVEKIKGSEERILGFIDEFGPLKKKDILSAFGESSASLLKSLKKKGLIEETYLTVTGIPKKPRKTYTGLDENDRAGENEANFSLNDEQHNAAEKIIGSIRGGGHRTFLLHGITGSGKTVVYIAAAMAALEEGGSAIVMVPEISLTPQTLRRFRSKFGDKVAVLHSKMTEAEKYDNWKKLSDGVYKIAVGPRSALFAPLKNLKLIIVDEEHDSSYKQADPAPRYCANSSAVMRGFLCGAPVVLGSATPSAESYQNAISGKYELLELKNRFSSAVLPSVRVLKRENPGSVFENASLELFSRELSAGRKIMVLQNRRGYSSMLICGSCGYTAGCPSCSVSMTYHLSLNQLVCHHCGYYEKGNDICPKCGEENLKFKGVGTQQVEEELKLKFPDFPVFRMDSDTTRNKDGHRKILDKFASAGPAVLVGTQMISKGLDFSDVSVVCIVNMDIELSYPDFRSDERAFQLLVQVAGRAGRGDIKGNVIVQTFNPDYPIIKKAVTHDYTGFMEEELSLRELTGYPPFSRLARLTLSSKEPEALRKAAEDLYTILVRNNSICTVYRPVEKMIVKVNNIFRLYILIKSLIIQDRNGKRLRDLVSSSLSEYKSSSKIKISIDVDPSDLM